MRRPGGRYRLSYLYAVIGVLLLVIAFLLLYPIRHTEDFAAELRLGIGTNLIDLALAAVVLQPLFVYVSRNAVRWRNRLDYGDVIRRIGRATERVDIWKHWTGLLEEPYDARFRAAVRGALDRGVRFRIMLTDPSSPDAAERARQVAPVDALALIRQNIDRLEAFSRELSATQRDHFEVRISAAGPAHALYRVDDWLSYGLFRNRRVSESSQREVPVHGDLGELALEAFEGRWNAPGVLSIAAHDRMAVRFIVDGATSDHELRYVVHDGDVWVNVPTKALPHAFHPDHRVSTNGDGSATHVLTSPTEETRERMTALYTAKYGPDQGVVLLRLTSARPGAGAT